jgi:exonuclease III
MNQLFKTLIYLILSTNYVFSQSILLDEDPSEWSQVETEYIDPTGDSNGLDVVKFQITNDDRFLYLLIEFNSEIELQENNDLVLYIDTDNNPNTGTVKNGIGYEFRYAFGERSGSYQSTSLRSYDIGLINSPTVTSHIFEIKIDIDAQINGSNLFSSDTIGLFFEASDGDEYAPDAGNPALYRLDEELMYLEQPFRIAKSSITDFRVLTYNSKRDALFDPSLFDEYDRILSAIKPDIIGFQEIYNNDGVDAAALIEQMLPSSAGEAWYYGDTGTDNLIVSRYPIINQQTVEGNSAYLLEMGDDYLFTIVAHPPCCSNEEGRQWEIDAFMGFLRDSKSGSEFNIPEKTPIIIMGDMNLVGLNRQQTTLTTGDIFYENDHGQDFNPDWDGSALDDAKPYNPGLPTSFTWYSPNSSYGAGRLDYVVYSGSVLEVLNSFSLHTPTLDQDSLTVYGLEHQDTIDASDHIPVVVDFKLKTGTSSSNPMDKPQHFYLGQNYPNPFNPSTTIPFSLDKPGFVSMSIHSVSGTNIVSIMDRKIYDTGSHSVTFDAKDLASGMYFVRLDVDGNIQNKPMMLIK